MLTRFALAYALVSGPLLAGTIKVPGDASTIAAAEALANDGDTILIGKGRWQESVVTSKRLTFRGVDGTIWDGFFGGVHNDQLVANADGVTVKDIEFQNGDSPIAIAGDDAVVTHCRFIAVGRQVSITGANAKVTRNRFEGSGSGEPVSLSIVGPDAVVDRNKLKNGPGGFIDIDAQSAGAATVSRNQIKNIHDRAGIRVVNAPGANISKNKVMNGKADTAIDVQGCPDATIKGNRVESLGEECNHGVFVEDSPNARITANTIANITDYDSTTYGIEIRSSDGTTVDRNEIRVVGAGEDNSTYGLFVLGDGCTVEKNVVEDLNGGGDTLCGIDVLGDDAQVLKNKVRRIVDEFSEGISVGGDRAVVSKNKVCDYSDGGGISVSGQDYTVTKNTVKDAGEDANGIETSGDATQPGSAIVAKNRVNDVPRHGFLHNGSGAHFSGNRAQDVGDDGFRISGNDNVFTSSDAVATGQDGFVVAGTGNTLTKCDAKHCARDGFDIDGDSTTLEECRAIDCAAEGLDAGHVLTASTTLTKCKLKDSRIDYAGASKILSDTGTTFSTGGPDTLPEID